MSAFLVCLGSTLFLIKFFQISQFVWICDWSLQRFIPFCMFDCIFFSRSQTNIIMRNILSILSPYYKLRKIFLFYSSNSRLKLNAIGKSLSVLVEQSLNLHLLLENFDATLSKKVFLAVLVIMPIIFGLNIGTFSIIKNIVKRLCHLFSSSKYTLLRSCRISIYI